MATCMTCQQPLPEGTTEHPSYFVQSAIVSTPETYLPNLAGEIRDLLQYLGAVLAMLPAAQDVGENVTLQLGWLSGELCDEAERRIELLLEALDGDEDTAAQACGKKA